MCLDARLGDWDPGQLAGRVNVGAQLWEESTLYICIYIPTNGPLYCWARERNGINLLMLFVQVCLCHLCNWPCMYVRMGEVSVSCVCMCLLGTHAQLRVFGPVGMGQQPAHCLGLPDPPHSPDKEKCSFQPGPQHQQLLFPFSVCWIPFKTRHWATLGMQ